MFKYLLQFFDMGGYGIYVWPCYAILLLMLSWYVVSIFKKNIAVRKSLANIWSENSSDQ
jgi:heme exporter protein CcmD